jgi:23S rRNA (adenine2503-C2)-methyltransferase
MFPMDETPIELVGLTMDEVVEAARTRIGRGFGVARKVYLRAILDAVYDPGEHGLGEARAEAWRRCFRFELPAVTKTIDEEDDEGRHTSKAVLRARDGLEYECVRIPMPNGYSTLCLSSQVGCKMGCTFCETGRMGLLRNLTAAEIVSQVIVARSVLGWEIKNVVFMGMGEALDNADNVLQALRVLNDRKGLHIGQQRITVCTVGHAEGIRKLAGLGWKRLNLSVSLNAPTDEARSSIMPFNKKVPLAALKEALAAYPKRSCFFLAVNYCLMPGINDRREDAAGIRRFLEGLGNSVVNLIPYNPGSHPIARAPSEEEIARFVRWLDEEKVPVRRRVTRGRSVMAACGQLGNVELRRPRAS